MANLDTPKLCELVKVRRGDECIYWEKRIIAHAELSEVLADDEGITLKLRDLHTPGFIDFPGPRDSCVTLGGEWDGFSYSEERWSGYAGWGVLFSMSLIESLREAVQHLAGAESEQRYSALVDCYYRDSG